MDNFLLSFKDADFNVSILEHLNWLDIKVNYTTQELFAAAITIACMDRCNFVISGKLHRTLARLKRRDRVALEEWVDRYFLDVEYRRLFRTFRHCERIEDIKHVQGSLYVFETT